MHPTPADVLPKKPGAQLRHMVALAADHLPAEHGEHVGKPVWSTNLPAAQPWQTVLPRATEPVWQGRHVVAPMLTATRPGLQAGQARLAPVRREAVPMRQGWQVDRLLVAKKPAEHTRQLVMPVWLALVPLGHALHVEPSVE